MAGPSSPRTSLWFPTLIHSALLGRDTRRFNRDLASEIAKIREFDTAGQAWSRVNYPGGYTSYGSMDRLHRFSSTFLELERRLNRHVRLMARRLDWDLGGAGLHMTDCWVNCMPRGVQHGLHLHPGSVLSGTYYVTTPRGVPGLKFEDPRLSRMMAAPPPLAAAREVNRRHIVFPATVGRVILFESWLRHEVAANPTARERVSISFNYAWG